MWNFSWGRKEVVVLAFLLTLATYSLSSSNFHPKQTDLPIAEAGPDQISTEGEPARFNGSLSVGSLGATVFGENVRVNDEHPWSLNARFQPDIRVDDFGVVHTIWSEYTGVHDTLRVYYSRSTNGGLSFQPSVTASNDSKVGDAGMMFPGLAVSPDGTVHVIWTNFQAGDYRPTVYYARSIDNGSSFETPMMISQMNVSMSVEVDSIGLVHVLSGGKDGNLYHSLSEDNGVSFAESHRVNDVEGRADIASMVVDEARTVHVVWSDARNSEPWGDDIYYSRSTDNGQSFSKDIRINDDTGYNFQDLGHVGIDSAGNPHVFWMDLRFWPDEAIMYSSSDDKGASFGKNKLLLLSNESNWVDLWKFDMKIGSDDMVRIVWSESFLTPRDSNIWSSELELVAGAFTNRVLVTDDLKNSTDQRALSISLDSEDNAYVVWLDNRNTGDKGDQVFYAKSKEGRAEITSYEWDMNSFTDTNADGNFTNDVDATGPTPTFAYGDDGTYVITLKVTDELGATAYDTATVTVLNVDPTISSVTYVMERIDASILFRIAGEKWHSVEVHLFEDDVEIGYANLTRYPGNPDDQTVSLADTPIDLSRKYSATAYYTPEDDPVNGQLWGATPAWFILKFDNEERRIHHTFNVRHEETWTWNIEDMNQHFPLVVSFEAYAFDPGSDDLEFLWDFGDGASASAMHYNNGIGPDPYPSPDINPVTAIDKQRHAFTAGGTYEIVLTVTDDDKGTVAYSFDLTV